MNKFRYLLSLSVARVLRGIKTNVILFLSFYLGMFLPLISMGNISFAYAHNTNLQYDNIEHLYYIQWSSEFLTEQQNNDFVRFLQGHRVEYNVATLFNISALDNMKVTIESNMNSNNEINGHNQQLCIVGLGIARKHKISVGQTLIIGDIPHIVHKIDSFGDSNSIEVPIKTFESLREPNAFMQHNLLVEQMTDENTFESNRVLQWFQENEILVENIGITNALDEYNAARDFRKPWIIARAIVGICGGLFALINIVAILIAKLQEQKKAYAIMLALGVKYSDLLLGFMMENFLIACFANSLLLITIPHILRGMDIEQNILIDAKVVIGLFAISLIMVIAINMILAHYLKKIPIIKNIQGE